MDLNHAVVGRFPLSLLAQLFCDTQRDARLTRLMQKTPVRLAFAKARRELASGCKTLASSQKNREASITSQRAKLEGIRQRLPLSLSQPQRLHQLPFWLDRPGEPRGRHAEAGLGPVEGGPAGRAPAREEEEGPGATGGGGGRCRGRAAGGGRAGGGEIGRARRGRAGVCSRGVGRAVVFC